MTRPDRTGYGGILLNNEFGKKVTIKTKLNAKKSMAEFDENDENVIIDNHDVSIHSMTFYYTVYDILKSHLFDCLRIANTGRTPYTLYQIVDFISIDQNLLNNSIGLLRQQSKIDITSLMRLYLYFCGPIQLPDCSKNGVMYREYSKQIVYIQKDMKEKFKDIIGNEVTSKKLHINRLQKLKKKTERRLLVLAKTAILKIKINSPLLPGTPLHFVCIDLLKWTALMESENEDAVKIQQMKITVDKSEITMLHYAERYRYEIDIGNLDPLNYEVLLRINNTLLHYVYKYFALLTALINTNISKSKPINTFPISLVTEQTKGLRAILEILNQFFVPRYLYYVKRLTAQTKLSALISYMDWFSADTEDTVREMELSPEKTVNDINELITEFAMALLIDLKVDDPQEWIDGVNKEVVGTSANISEAMDENKKKAFAIIALCVKHLNPDWPNIKYRDPNEFLTATKLAHQILHTDQYDYVFYNYII
ncbi:uncharacterized protein LOC126842490 isoform X2 [Adelges cooleyi]|uniref:uncharacterized protein LOC126842490 isoform X1 n=1 Tax=Adelges cooleyi TaxID=133065 RepID=UPI00217F952F|nr:uncharacterized protein LOC126842490 isoform X1 [Adelges cooleyi]XP_050435460.1 uncharacterized protein LOC126842490 isoform X2 [Adelges cooleyi]